MRRYNENFKFESVKLAKEIGPSKAAKELGIPVNTLNNWIAKIKSGQIFKEGDKKINLAEENSLLEREIRELKRANLILRKAAAFFAESQKR